MRALLGVVVPVPIRALLGWAARAGLGVEATTLVAMGANVAIFGSLWAAQYFILDRVLFAARDHTAVRQDL